MSIVDVRPKVSVCCVHMCIGQRYSDIHTFVTYSTVVPSPNSASDTTAPNERSKTNEKAIRETKTLRAGCSKAKPKNFAPPQTLSGGAGRPKFNKLEMVTTFTYKPSLVMIDALNFELSWDTHKQTRTPTNTHKPIDSSDYNKLRRS